VKGYESFFSSNTIDGECELSDDPFSTTDQNVPWGSPVSEKRTG
jgi:hypothetical protein